MEESYETFEEELGPQRAGPPLQKPVHRQPGVKTHTHTKNLTFTERKQITRVFSIHPLGIETLPEKHLVLKWSRQIKTFLLPHAGFGVLCVTTNVSVFEKEKCLLHPPSIQQAAFAFWLCCFWPGVIFQQLSSIYRVAQYLQATTDEGSACVRVCVFMHACVTLICLNIPTTNSFMKTSK